MGVLISEVVLYTCDTFGTARNVRITVDVRISGVSARQGVRKAVFHCSSIQDV